MWNRVVLCISISFVHCLPCLHMCHHKRPLVVVVVVVVAFLKLVLIDNDGRDSPKCFLISATRRLGFSLIDSINSFTCFSMTIMKLLIAILRLCINTLITEVYFAVTCQLGRKSAQFKFKKTNISVIDRRETSKKFFLGIVFDLRKIILESLHDETCKNAKKLMEYKMTPTFE